ncbi:arsenical pump-driving ATPase [Chitinimonas sp. BJYL2]|uniref:arsenical pump-driving ATPase n=1 Tax=Chitinimonas sp. BJYL2 TaxID=2976696 RepID=UPI0022B3A891|nr:arsenical pump-driving ATPase [Chitinimonas sp. BJYL2]
MNPLTPLLDHPTRFIFFTGKGGVGKTSVSTATAIALADRGKRVLLVSTDSASNLDEMLGVQLRNQPVAVPGVPGLAVMNIDPDVAAQNYRVRVVAQMGDTADDDDIATVREQLSGACTTEIATFDEFASLLSGDAPDYDHLIFDTAPTGHTLRLLSLPKAWTGFLAGNDRGASCLGPHSGLKMQEQLFNLALATLNDPSATMVVLVARAETGSLREAARTSSELSALGLTRQRLIINAVFRATRPDDPIAHAIEALGQQALHTLPDTLRKLETDYIPLRPFDSVGLPALRALLSAEAPAPQADLAPRPKIPHHTLSMMVSKLAAADHGLIMVMGKGGVGKTTLAAAIALGLVREGKSVHLTTTDPAAHLAGTLQADIPGLTVSRIHPQEETRKYVEKVMASRGRDLNEAERALMLEDLRSPCTEEVAVFHAFSRVVSQARSAFVVLDTAPTGHSLLLMDAAGAYHRQMQQAFEGQSAAHLVTPLMRLQDKDYTKVILITLPESTPVSQAAALQADLRRAQIEPFGWIINKSLLATHTADPLLQARLQSEYSQYQRVRAYAGADIVAIPWVPTPPLGAEALRALLDA